MKRALYVAAGIAAAVTLPRVIDRLAVRILLGRTSAATQERALEEAMLDLESEVAEALGVGPEDLEFHYLAPPAHHSGLCGNGTVDGLDGEDPVVEAFARNVERLLRDLDDPTDEVDR